MSFDLTDYEGEQKILRDLCLGFEVNTILERSQISLPTFHRYKSKLYSQLQATSLHELVVKSDDLVAFPEGIRQQLKNPDYDWRFFSETGQKILFLLNQGVNKPQILEFLSISASTYQGYLVEYRLYFQLKELYRIVVLCRWLKLF